MSTNNVRSAPHRSLFFVLGALLFFSGCNAFEMFYQEGSSGDPEVLLEDARFAMQRGDHQKAVTILEKAHERDPNNGIVRAELSGALLLANDYTALDIIRIAEHLQREADDVIGKAASSEEYCSFSDNVSIIADFNFRDFSQFDRLLNTWPIFKRVVELIEPLLPPEIYSMEPDVEFDAEVLLQKIVHAGAAEWQKKSVVLTYAAAAVVYVYLDVFASESGAGSFTFYRVRDQHGSESIGYCGDTSSALDELKERAGCSLRKLRGAAVLLKARAEVLNSKDSKELAQEANKALARLQKELGAEGITCN